jgi:hypothetical protein
MFLAAQRAEARVQDLLNTTSLTDGGVDDTIPIEIVLPALEMDLDVDNTMRISGDNVSRRTGREVTRTVTPEPESLRGIQYVECSAFYDGFLQHSDEGRSQQQPRVSPGSADPSYKLVSSSFLHVKTPFERRHESTVKIWTSQQDIFIGVMKTLIQLSFLESLLWVGRDVHFAL